MTLPEFRDILLSVTPHVHHFEAYGEIDGEHIVWQETGGRTLNGEDGRQEVIKEIQVDLYTKNEFAEILDNLLEALEAADVAFEEPVTSYDKDTGYIRHIIECEVL